MKLLNKLIFAVVALVMIAGCEATNLDLLDSPNSLTPDNASLNDLYNNVQLGFRDVFTSAQGTAGAAARMYHAGGGTYEDFAPAETYNGLWNDAYRDFFPDATAIINIATENGFDIHAGTAKIMQGYVLSLLVDLFGDVPYSEAFSGTDIISPSSDAGASVYDAAKGLLDDGIKLLTGSKATPPAYDNFYGGDTLKWRKFANTVKLKMAVNTGDGGTVSSLAGAGNIISSAGDDFQFQYGSQRTNPNSRHPFYQSHYEVDDGAYLSNYFMWLLAGDKVDVDGNAITDPRIRYYFYKKVEDSENQDQTTYSCHFSIFPEQSAKPAHWESTSPNVPYCVIPSSGYSGRDHLNPDGTPPDGPIRTSYGLYPGGGQFDDDTFDDTRKAGTTGGLGEGIWPILISPTVDLLRAEAALRLGTGEDAKALLESGIKASIAKAVGFEELVPGTMSRLVDVRGELFPVSDLFGTTSDDIDEYVSKILALYDAASDDGKLDLIAKEQMIASWGNGLEAYNLYRRTGKPNNMQPALEASYGEFPRSFLYPANHVTRNASVSQKSLSDGVFWVDGSIDLY